MFEAYPREWTDPEPSYLYAGPMDAAQLLPFLRVQVSGLAAHVHCERRNASGLEQPASYIRLYGTQDR